MTVAGDRQGNLKAEISELFGHFHDCYYANMQR